MRHSPDHVEVALKLFLERLRVHCEDSLSCIVITANGYDIIEQATIDEVHNAEYEPVDELLNLEGLTDE